MNMDPKPGYLTTEFWGTMLTHVITIVLLFNANLNSDKLSALVPMASLLMSGLAQAWYSHSRGHAKVASLAAAAQVVSTQVMASPDPVEPPAVPVAAPVAPGATG
jgi:hypothetical protein